MKKGIALFSLIALLQTFAGCIMQDPNLEMMPLKGAGESPTNVNRFPASRGGFGHSPVDDPGYGFR